MNHTIDWAQLEALSEELVEDQRNKLLDCALRILPHVTAEDLLQPNDFIELENHPHFRYEEGVLAGLQSFQMALRAIMKS